MKPPSKVRPYLVGFAFGFLGFLVFATAAVIDGQISRIEQARKGTALERSSFDTAKPASSPVAVMPLEPSPFTPVSVNTEKTGIGKVIPKNDITSGVKKPDAVLDGKNGKPPKILDELAINEASEISSSTRPNAARGQFSQVQNAQGGSSTSTRDADLAARATRNAMLKMGYRFGSTLQDAVKHLQANLKALGYYSGPISGVFDSRTRAAVAKFQVGLEGVKPWGFPNEKTVREILNSGPSSVPLE